MTDKKLIIIASQPRSGSTLLQALLSNNKSVGTVSEPWLLLPFLGYGKAHLNRSKYNSELAKEGIDDFKEKISSDSFDKDLSIFLLDQYAKILRDKEDLVLDKTPRYYEILDEILHYFPNCKIIILKRHPFAVLNSIIKTWHVSSLNRLLEYKRDLLHAPFLLNDFVKKHDTNPQVYQLRYEDLVKRPSVEVKALYQWLELPFTSNVLNYVANKKYHGYMGDPTGVQQTDRPNSHSLKEWQSLFQDPYWAEFAAGYHNFLTKEFLKDYGHYTVDSVMKIKSTKMFKLFLERAKWNFHEHEVPKWKLLKYTFLRRIGLLKY